MQFKCLQCDKLVYNEDAPDCPQACGGKHLRQAALIHWLIPSETSRGVGSCVPLQFQEEHDEAIEEPTETKAVPHVIACKPSQPDLKLSQHNASPSPNAVTCQRCRQLIQERFHPTPVTPDGEPEPTDPESPTPE